MTAQRLGMKIVNMKNSSMKNTSKTSHQGKINIYFCLIIEAKHILMLFERVIKFSSLFSFEIVYLWERIEVIRQGGFLGPLLLSSSDKPIRSFSKYYVVY